MIAQYCEPTSHVRGLSQHHGKNVLNSCFFFLFFFKILVPPPGNSRTESQLRQPETGKRLKWESWNNKSSSWSWR